MPADPRRVKDLFGAAAAIADPAARDAFLDSECRDEPEVRQRLRDLLRAHDHPESALERPLAVANPESTTNLQPVRGAVGTVVAGKYKLLELIGEGGMGEVWVADQLEPLKRRVALKMIKPGMDSRSILGRFDAERQALALMDHPNIAKVLDAGTTDDGRPYFVMELVKGTPITEFCDARKLSPRERLKLFVPLCQAIQHAHTKGIIHRDIKPGNVLVALHDEKPVVKVIDFGIAKAVGQQLTEKTVYTGFGALVGTPAYMAPEQATFNQLDIDTRADVYALGVLLYELLAGSPPFEPERLKLAALDEVLRLVREEEPQRPSQRLSTSQAKATIAATRQSDPEQLARLIRGELDWIVMKSLEKDRNRRYESAAGLAKDVERYLADEPVEACPPTLSYRLRKAYRKNRAAVITTLVVLLGAILAVAGQTWNLLRARAAESDAVAARNSEAKQRGETAKERDAAIEARKDADRERTITNEALAKLRLAQERQLDDQYVWDMQLLPLAFEANNVAEVQRLLDRHVPQSGQRDRRGFEWFYWDRKLHTDLRTSQLPDVRAGQGVWSASSDGTRIALFTIPNPNNPASDEQPVLTVWEVASRKVMLTHRMALKRPPLGDTYQSTNPLFPVFSMDGKRVAVEWSFLSGTLGMQRQRQVLDVASGKVLLQLDGDRGGRSSPARSDMDAAFSPDGRRFAAVGDTFGDGKAVTSARRVYVWDVDAGKELCPPLDADGLADCPFSPDGNLLVTRKSQRLPARVSVWNLADGKEQTGWSVQDRGISALAFSPDGKYVAAAIGSRPQPKAGVINPPIESQSGVIWSVETGREFQTLSFPALESPGSRYTRVFFSPDGSRLAVERSSTIGGGGRPAGDLSVWDMVSLKPLPSPVGLDIGTLALRNARGPTFSPDSKQFVSAEGNVLRTWSVDTGKPVLTLRGHVNRIAARSFLPSGKGLWSLDYNGLLKEWALHPVDAVAISFVAPRDPQLASALATSADASRVAAIIEIRTNPSPVSPPTYAVRVWDAAGKPVNNLLPPALNAERLARGAGQLDVLVLSRDGRRAALVRPDRNSEFDKTEPPAPPGDLTVWDVETKKVLLNQKLESKHAPFVALAPDGRTVAVTSQTAPGHPVVRLFDVDTQRERTPLAAEATGIPGIYFSPDGRRLVGLAETHDYAARIFTSRLVVWDVERAAKLCVMEIDNEGPYSVNALGPRLAWAPDSLQFAAAHGRRGNSMIAIHDATTGKIVRTLEQPTAGDAEAYNFPHLAYSPDGTRVAAFMSARFLGGTPVLKVWDVVSGKELLVLRPIVSGHVSGQKRLTFSGDGHRLQFAELVSATPPPGSGAATSSIRSLLLTTWDATPVTEREPKKP